MCSQPKMCSKNGDASSIVSIPLLNVVSALCCYPWLHSPLCHWTAIFLSQVQLLTVSSFGLIHKTICLPSSCSGCALPFSVTQRKNLLFFFFPDVIVEFIRTPEYFCIFRYLDCKFWQPQSYFIHVCRLQAAPPFAFSSVPYGQQ